MSLDIDSLSTSDADACMAYVNWALDMGLWDGKPISWLEASDFTEEMETRIVSLLLAQDPDDVAFYKISANLALMGASPECRYLLNEDIRELGLTPEGMIIQAGLGKSLKKFWRKHKVEILIGVGVVAVVTAIAIASLCTAGAAAGAAAGGAALGKANDPKLPIRKGNPELPPEPAAKTQMPFVPTPVPGKMVFVENGVLLGGQYLTYNEVMQRARFENFFATPIEKEHPAFEFPSVNHSVNIPQHSLSSEDKSWLHWALETIGQEFIFGESDIAYEKSSFPQGSNGEPDQTWKNWALQTIGNEALEGESGYDYKNPFAEFPPTSRYFVTEGVRQSHIGIGGINGIGTSFSVASSHANYLSKFTPEMSVDWIHNHSNGPVADVGESFLLNYCGVSPNTGTLLKENWIAFHEANKDNPNAKYLQFCHSQGAIHVRNELLKLPEEIRKRIIVVAIAPAAIVPKDLCYDSFNYASKSDVVYLGELLHAYSVGQNEDGQSELFQAALDKQNQLILLDPHPDAKGMDHAFQSPTFIKTIAMHMKNYIDNNGVY